MLPGALKRDWREISQRRERAAGEDRGERRTNFREEAEARSLHANTILIDK